MACIPHSCRQTVGPTSWIRLIPPAVGRLRKLPPRTHPHLSGGFGSDSPGLGAPVHDTASRSLGSPPRFLRVSTSKNSVSSPSPLFCGLHGCHVGLRLAPFGAGSLSSKSWLSQVTCGGGKGPCLSGKWRRRMAQAPGGPGGVGSPSSRDLSQNGSLSLSLETRTTPSVLV